MSDPKPKLRRFQYSLRTLLIVVTLCAIPCSWLAVKRHEAKRQREAMAEILKLGGDVRWSIPSGPAWFRTLLGDDLFRHVECVRSDERSSDAVFEQLKDLGQLQSLDLEGSQVTDAGLEHLKGLGQLQVLTLFNTNVTDAGLEHLKGLGQLQVLNLFMTKVTDTGVKKLQQALPNCKIYLRNAF